MHIIYSLAFVFAGWKWGDWKNWQLYYPTILFMIIVDITHSILTYNYSTWEYATSFDKSILPNHTLISFTLDFINFPAAVLIFLGNYPETKGKIKQILYIIMWIFIFTMIEIISFYTWGGVTYHNGWNIWWSILVNIITLPMLVLHYKKPLWAVLLSTITIVLFCIAFGLPLDNMK